jgi:hypothetical protein
MDPTVLAALISAAVSVGGGILGEMLGSEEDKQAYEYRKQALSQYLGISVPELEELVAKEQGQTNLANVRTDPALDAYQDQALARLSEVGTSNGLDAQSRARMEQARIEQAQAERNSREAVLASARARGTLGTGEEVSALLQSGQASADRARMADVQTLGDAESRALDAIIAAGGMAGTRQARQWDQRAEVASAQDAIDRFNTATANDFTLANADQRALNFQQRMQLAGAKAGAYTGMAEHHEARGERTRQTVGGIGQSVGYGGGALGQHIGGQSMGGGGGAAAASAPGVASKRSATNFDENPAAIGSYAALSPALATRRKAR